MDFDKEVARIGRRKALAFFAKHLLLIALAAAVAIVLVWMYSDWHACSAAGGTTVRGLFKLECINPKPPNNQVERPA